MAIRRRNARIFQRKEVIKAVAPLPPISPVEVAGWSPMIMGTMSGGQETFLVHRLLGVSGRMGELRTFVEGITGAKAGTLHVVVTDGASIIDFTEALLPGPSLFNDTIKVNRGDRLTVSVSIVADANQTDAKMTGVWFNAVIVPDREYAKHIENLHT